MQVRAGSSIPIRKSLVFLATFGLTLIGAANAALSATPSADSEQEKHLVAQSFLGEKLWVWQKRLKLAEWKIRLNLTRVSQLKPRTLGNIHWDADTHSAEINVMAPEDYKLSMHDMLADMEFTVVHELIHLELSSLPRSEASRSAEEHAVNQITQALLNLDRKPSGQD